MKNNIITQTFTTDENFKKVITYNEYPSDNIYINNLTINSPYNLDTDLDGNKIILPNLNQNPDLSYFLDLDYSNTYYPMEDNSILINALNLDINNIESILDFCNKYGLLYIDSSPPKKISFNLSNTGNNANISICPLCSSIKISLKLDTFKTEIIMLKRIYTLWDSINHSNFDNIHNCINEFPNIKSSHWNKNDDLQLGISLLSDYITQKLLCVKKSLHYTNSNKFIPIYTYSTLCQVIYLQLCDLITNGSDTFHKCFECNSYFSLADKRGNRKFCPNTVGKNRRSTCENNFNQKVHKCKKSAISLYKEGKNINEIYQLINNAKYAPLEKIKEWLE